MAKSGNALLAEALTAAQKVAINNIVNSKDITSSQRTFLIKKGYLKTILRGWYLLDANLSTKHAGESALWFASLWDFVGQYLASKYNNDYWLSPEASLDLHTSNNTMPKQLIVYIPKGKGTTNIVALPNNMSLLISPTVKQPREIIQPPSIDLNILSLEESIVSASPRAYVASPRSLQLALRQADDSRLATALLHSENIASASRIIGALEAMNLESKARKLESIINATGYQGLNISNPFKIKLISITPRRNESPSAIRVRMMWQQMRSTVIKIFESFPPPHNFKQRSISDITSMMSDIYAKDAYHSLSIEGYKVTPELIQRVASGEWSPEIITQDKQAKDALAARGYHLAFKQVEVLIKTAHQDSNLDLESMLDIGLTQWYSSLFSPCVDAGIVKPVDIAGYRKGPIYIRLSKHVPPPSEQLTDCIDTLKELIANENHSIVQAILGHLCLGYIHPFPDGNGRTARFLMNFMLVLGGYDWTVITMEQRSQYMSALEAASVHGDITPFANFVLNTMQAKLSTYDGQG